MFKTRLGITGVAGYAVAAMLAMAALPPEHLHRAEAGEALVHRHLADHHADLDHDLAHDLNHDDAEARDSGAFLDHDDDATARTIEAAFKAQPQYDLHRQLISAGLPDLPPDAPLSVRVARIDAAPTHGPPIRIRSLRAPPS